MAAAYIGNTDFTAQPVTRYFVEGQGWATVVPYTGSKTKLNDFLAVIFVIGNALGPVSAMRMTEDGPIARVEITYAASPTTAPDPIARTWTLVPNLVEVDIANLPQIQDGFTYSGINVKGLYSKTTDEIIEFRKKLSLMLTGDTDERFDTNTIESFIFALKAREETSFILPQYVLRKTDTVFAQSQLAAAHANKGKIHNYADLVNAEPTLPAAILIDPLNLSIQTEGGKPLNWLKMAPEVDQVTGGRYQIVQEYWAFAHFNPFIYDTVQPFNEALYNQTRFSF